MMGIRFMTKARRYELCRKEMEDYALKFGRDAGIMDYRLWFNNILGQGGFYMLRKTPIDGSARYTPLQLKPVVLHLLDWLPLMSAHMIRNYSDIPRMREGLEDDLWMAFERVSFLEKGKVDENKVLANLAYSVLLKKNLADARRRFGEIGEIRGVEITPEIIPLLIQNGYTSRGESGPGRVLGNHGLKLDVLDQMKKINGVSARLVAG
jgi:hypothetical protein